LSTSSQAYLATALADDNLVAILAPQQVINAAVENKLSEDLIKNLPVLADADKKHVLDVIEKVSRPLTVRVKGDTVEFEQSGVKGRVSIATTWKLARQLPMPVPIPKPPKIPLKDLSKELPRLHL
jgi:hypothetical protein